MLLKQELEKRQKSRPVNQVKNQPFRILKHKLIDIDFLMVWNSPGTHQIPQAKGVNRHADDSTMDENTDQDPIKSNIFWIPETDFL